ncbi:hypothetical protein F2Q69_00063423 [Brassica cretica]|uniref:Uncharacterized protein n=1 Tax=Brassica cretica TaxID=69181 RepID=A0A8S9RGA5_BRACR|nr:hypothetical protein F2Q69_00063423 [Brassica cretica]
MGLLESVKSIDWELESPPVYRDFRVLPLFAVFFPSVRFLLDRFVFETRADRVRLDRRERERYACAPIAIGLRTSDRERELSGMRAEAEIGLRSSEAETGRELEQTREQEARSD